MILKVNNLQPVQITLPSAMCFIWHHLGWFLGVIQISAVGLVGASDSLSPGQLKVALVISGVITAVTSYVKANPPPSLNQDIPP